MSGKRAVVNAMKDRRMWGGGLFLTALCAVFAYVAGFQHTMSVDIRSLPNGNPAESGVIRFRTDIATYWYTERYGYFEVMIKERGWRALGNLRRFGALRTAQAVFRVPAPFTEGSYGIPTRADAYVVFLPGTGVAAWHAAQGTVTLHATRDEIAASGRFTLQRAFPEAQFWQQPDEEGDETVSLLSTKFRRDAGAGVNIFNPAKLRFMPGLRAWLDEDPGLEEIVPKAEKTQQGL